jgi:hypothetical protein
VLSYPAYINIGCDTLLPSEAIVIVTLGLLPEISQIEVRLPLERLTDTIILVPASLIILISQVYPAVTEND